MIYFIEFSKVLFAFALVMSLAPILVWLERKICAWCQGRVGPNRVGPAGLLQPLADFVKLMFKEDIVPANADRFMYMLAPVLAMGAPIILFAFIPFGPDLIVGGLGGHGGSSQAVVRLQLCDLGVSLLLFMAVLSTAVFAVAFGGWASNNKYSLLGGLRAASQLISYELILGLSFLYVLAQWNSASFREIAMRQAGGNWTVFTDLPFSLVFALTFFITALAENKRLPFDLPEAEAELVGGYHTEYSSMKFALFFLGEYVAITMMSCCMVVMFFGGYDLFGLVKPAGGLLNAAFGMACFLAKTFVLIFAYMWVRWTLPRFRYDYLMKISWQYLLPAALLILLAKAVV